MKTNEMIIKPATAPTIIGSGSVALVSPGDVVFVGVVMLSIAAVPKITINYMLEIR